MTVLCSCLGLIGNSFHILDEIVLLVILTQIHVSATNMSYIIKTGNRTLYCFCLEIIIKDENDSCVKQVISIDQKRLIVIAAHCREMNIWVKTFVVGFFFFF